MENSLLHPPVCCSNTGVNGISAAVVLESVQKSLEARLAGRLGPVIDLARDLPPFSGNMLELHFDRPDSPFDFAFRINRQYDGPLLSPVLLQHKIAPYVLEGYSQLFQKPLPGFRYGMENSCFEYDFPFQTPPALFFDLHRNAAFHPDTIYGHLKKIAGAFQYPIQEELLGFFVKAKHLGLKVVYYGLMLSRNCASVRLTIEGIEAETLAGTARKLGWAGDEDALIGLQKKYLKAYQKIVLCVDFEKGPGSKLGIEVHDPDWNAFVETIPGGSVCGKKHRELLASWKGKTTLSAPLSKALTSIHQRTIDCIYRRINHFKFTVDKGLFQTKAYLYYCF